MISWAVRRRVRRLRNAIAARRLERSQADRWRAIVATPARTDRIAVSYGVERMPGPGEVVVGGAVKFGLLERELPNAPRDFNVLYLGSSSLPVDAARLVRLARRRGAAFVWNQNGVAYPAWYGPGWQEVNRPMRRLLHEADHVFFQSAFCRLAADTFLGKRDGPSEILYNPVDVERFTPGPRAERPLTLLLGGSQYQRYRLELALDTLQHVRREIPDARLLVTGALSFAERGADEAAAMVAARGLAGAVELAGPYSRQEAPDVLRRGDVLLHTKVNDPCPSVVLEAMASGLPVAYSATGGTPELVGDVAGAGVPGELDWANDRPPAADALAAAVLELAARLDQHAQAARARAVERFDLRRWTARHRDVFTGLLHARSTLAR